MSRPGAQHGRGRRLSRGVAIIEFIIASPLLFLLVLAIAEIGRALVQYATLANSVRNAARYVASEAYVGSTGVISVTSDIQTQGKNLVAYGTIGPGTPILPRLSPAQVTVSNAGAGNIAITVVYPYEPIVGATLPNFGTPGDPVSLSFNMSVVSTMRGVP